MAPAHADGKDWFSALPDDIVLHIMTFLTTRQAVRTFLDKVLKLRDPAASIRTFCFKFYRLTRIEASSDFCQNLRSLSAAKNLTCHFYYDGKKLTIENNLQRYPKFINLVSLTLGQWCLDANFYGLIVFLRNSPILEKLNLELEKHRWGKTSQRMIGELEERSFTCEHLTSVKVKCLADDPLVNGVVNFFVKMGLNSAQVHIEHWSQPALG
ncbi:hypothetical protein OsJ_30606 [Oryza sativa Japonica Group]|uniref:F-box domain-containing protein n=2 Tax=Oryza sativa subsp. japonica TaxID=39947 RepID=A3C274_ORYSJ|nr:Unknown protein [Oryza sativa Japonica Group]AAM23235.1 Unknown protein [Oryza sativa Japonica Group]AAP51973.1 hypothetical protein LOC_Os10g03900 [Oryza sativa Japonica Group]EAZ15187.1 hypothetical protein OsJ_30606 [Oryza sativa Japonica Group]